MTGSIIGRPSERRTARADADVVVVGGGPAGLAVALEARRAGLEVLVLEARHPPVDKACGEGLMPSGTRWLEERRVRLPAERHALLTGVRYRTGALEATGTFSGTPGLGVRRTTLHRALAERAEASGVEVAWGLRATGFRPDAVETASGVLRGRWLVGADGLHSRIRAWLGGGGPYGRCRFGVRRHFRCRPWSDSVEVHWSDGAEAYVTPVGPQEVGIALLWSASRARFDGLLGRFPELRERLASVPATTPVLGAGPLAQRARNVRRGRWFLVGDAAGSLDAISGEGISLAFRQATALVEALIAEEPTRYPREYRRLMRLPGLVTRELLRAHWRPRLRDRLVGGLAAHPDLMSGMLRAHAEAEPVGPAQLWRVMRLLLAMAISG